MGMKTGPRDQRGKGGMGWCFACAKHHHVSTFSWEYTNISRGLKQVTLHENPNCGEGDQNGSSHHQDERVGMVLQRQVDIHTIKARNHGWQADHDRDRSQQLHHHIQVVGDQ